MFEVSIYWQSIAVDPKRETVDRATLLAQPDACVRVGDAPDGLPLLLNVTRAASIIEPVLRAMHAGSIKELSGDARKLLLTLNARLQSERRELGILADGPAGGPHYVSMRTVDSLMGPTLLSRILGGVSPLLLPEDNRNVYREEAEQLACRTSAGVLMTAEQRVLMNLEIGSRQQLMLPLNDEPAGVVRMRDNGLDVANTRPMVFEDLRRLPSATFHGYRRVEGENRTTRFRGELGDNEAYQAAVRRADAIGFTVSRGDLLRSVAEVARALSTLHKDGLVHGDIKPANVLITKDGAIAHDPLGIHVGQLSPAGSKGWNAPEQIIARPVSPATDVFALAQLVVKILEAAVFGDERSFVVPVGNGQRIRERLLATPDVYLDPSLIPFDDAAIAAWRDFLRTCLALDSEKRVRTADAFADQLLSILDDHPVPGERVLTSGLAGQLTCSASGSSGASIGQRVKHLLGASGEQCAWVLTDSYSHLHRSPWRLWMSAAA